MRKLSIIAAAVAMTAGTLAADIQVGKGLTVGGFIDLQYGNTSGDGGAADSAGFNAATAEFNFGFDFGKGLTATVDLEGNVASDGTSSTGDVDPITNTATNTGGVEIEQARIDYAFGQSTLTLGKFDTFIGLEGIDAPDLYQVSNGLTFQLEPIQHEGIAYSYDAGFVNVTFGVMNSVYSDNGNADGAGDELAYAAHLGFVPVESVSLNVNYAVESDDDGTTNEDFDLLTFDASYSNYGWTVAAEYAQVDYDVTAGDQVDHDAWMIMVNYMVTEQFGLTARYGELETDEAGDSTLEDITLAASYAITPNWSTIIEYRMEETGADINATNAAYGLSTTGAGQEADTITIRSLLTF